MIQEINNATELKSLIADMRNVAREFPFNPLESFLSENNLTEVVDRWRKEIVYKQIGIAITLTHTQLGLRFVWLLSICHLDHHSLPQNLLDELVDVVFGKENERKAEVMVVPKSEVNPANHKYMQLVETM